MLLLCPKKSVVWFLFYLIGLNLVTMALVSQLNCFMVHFVGPFIRMFILIYALDFLIAGRDNGTIQCSIEDLP